MKYFALIAASFCFCLLIFDAASLPRAYGQEDSENTDTNPDAVDEQFLTLKKQLKSPRDTIATFVEAMKKENVTTALNCLDLTHLDAETRAAKGYTLAYKLHRVLQHPSIWDQNLEKVSDYPNFEPPYSLGENGDAQIIQLFPTGNGLWKFSRSTTEAVDQALYEKCFAGVDVQTGALDQTALPISMRIGQLFPSRMQESWF